MFIYNNNGKIITSPVLIKGLTKVEMTNEQAKHCIGFDENNNPLYNQEAVEKENEYNRRKLVNEINAEFEKQCSKIGVLFEGNYFQYDDTSRARLLEVKDDDRVNVWRSVNDVFIPMTNTQKNNLYSTLVYAFYSKFQEKSQEIDSL